MSNHEDIIYPEARVLVGVINRKRDFIKVRDEHWYRIPRDRAPRSIDAEYLAFYFSGFFKGQNGGIHYYARNRGHELVRRRDLLPKEADHQRANNLYFKLQIGDLQSKVPPITNPTGRSISFIYTTWDRFVAATTIADLYSTADWYVERVYRVLRREGIISERCWQDEDPKHRIAELRIRCERGLVAASAVADDSNSTLALPVGDSDDDVQAGVTAIRNAIRDLGGPTFVDIPIEG